MKSTVYFNIRRKIFSIKRGGRVVARHRRVCLRDCKFKVSEAGRQRVLKEKKKNVHAFVVGQVIGRPMNKKSGCSVTYNPYKHKTFVRRWNGKPVHTADFVFLEVVGGKAFVEACKPV